MGYSNLQQCVRDLQKTGHLLRLDVPVDANLEAGAIQRRVFQSGGPAILFTHIKDCPFPMLANLFGTLERTHYIFRDSLETIRRFIQLKVDPHDLFKHPFYYKGIPSLLTHLRPKYLKSGPVLQRQTTLSHLPQLKSWNVDGGAYITLPQVYSESTRRPGYQNSNLGMYRVQISGNRYVPDQEAGLHYHIHRGIGIHHQEALQDGKPFRVNIFVGGPPAMTIAAIMPLPEGMPELAFAGALANMRIPMIQGPLPISAEADFCISATIDPTQLLPEGPFGDHLGYYSLQHDFPVLKIDAVYHRADAIWPFTTVGRPPQEDTVFGNFIHELTGPIIPTVIPGVKEVHAVDAAGVHPLLLAIGSERYTPYLPTERPQEILTQAHALLGTGQLSLCKYLLIASVLDAPHLTTHDVQAFIVHILERVDWQRDLHFHTRSTMDTLDYTGGSLNQGSKLVIAAVGPRRRSLSALLPPSFTPPYPFKNPKIALPGVLLLEIRASEVQEHVGQLCQYLETQNLDPWPLIILVDDSQFTSQNLENFLWVTFTRSDPARDIFGVKSSYKDKHWGCAGSLIIDATIKPHHAPALQEDPEIQKRVDALGAPGKPLHGVI